MNLKVIVASLALATVAVAQTGAQTLYANARTAHGTLALDALKTLRTTATFTAGTASFTQLASYDFERGILRLEVRDGTVTTQVFRVSPSEAKVWSNKGIKNLDAVTAASVRYGFLEGVLALRPASAGWTTVSGAGAVQVAGQNGTGLTLGNATQNVTLALSNDGTLIAQRFTASGHDVQLGFSDYRVTNGLKFAFLERFYQNGVVVSSLAYTIVAVNPTFTDTDLALPQ
jgi:hypothetical protein